MKEKSPKDLGIKIGTPKQVLWKQIKERTEQEIRQAEAQIEIGQKVLELAKDKLKDLN